MLKRNSKSIKDFFKSKIQKVSDSGDTNCLQPKDECGQKGTVFSSPATLSVISDAIISSHSNLSEKSPIYVFNTCSDAVSEEATEKEDSNALEEPNNESVESNSYYWKNFLGVLAEVQGNENLKDLFIPLELSILKTFNDLVPEAQMLYIRLLNRKHSWLKTSSIKYIEINADLSWVINILIEEKFFITDTFEEDTNTLLNLMSVPDLRALCKGFRLKSDGKKETLAKALINLSRCQKSVHGGSDKNLKTVVRERIIEALGKMVKLNDIPRKLLLRVMLLHALPLGREMEMDGRIPVMNEVSRVKSNQVTYPDYSLHPLKNFLKTHGSLIRFQEALELLAAIEGEMLTKNYEEVLSLHSTAINHFRNILKDSDLMKEDMQLPLYLRSFTAGYVLARAVIICTECLRMKKMHSEVIAVYETLLSQDIYVPHHRGKWYDQLALVHHHHMKNVPAAVEILVKGLTDKSLSDVDKLLLSNRVLMIVNKKTKKKEEIERNRILTSLLSHIENPPEITITATCISSKIGLGSKISYVNHSEDGLDQVLSSVEETVILHYKHQGYDKGIHAENAVSMSIFGILFWDIIYSINVDNVFVCPYQTKPLDLKSGEFYINRKESVDKRLKEIEEEWSMSVLRDHFRSVCAQEKGKESIVSWRTFEDLDQFEVLMECVGLPVITRICERMAKNFPVACRGFPDIIIWNSINKSYKFLEVKGPGDRLSPSQVSWLNYLNASGACAAVCHVKSLGSKSLKRQLDISDRNEVIELD